MSKEVNVYIYAQEGTYQMSDSQLKKTSYGDKVGVLYGFNNYCRNVDVINQLAEYIKKDFPTIENKDMEVWYIQNSQSRRHAGYTMLWIMIPVGDFIRLRNEGIINIL